MGHRAYLIPVINALSTSARLLVREDTQMQQACILNQTANESSVEYEFLLMGANLTTRERQSLEHLMATSLTQNERLAHGIRWLCFHSCPLCNQFWGG